MAGAFGDTMAGSGADRALFELDRQIESLKRHKEDTVRQFDTAIASLNEQRSRLASHFVGASAGGVGNRPLIGRGA